MALSRKGRERGGLFLLFIVKKKYSPFSNDKFAFHGRVSVLYFKSKKLPVGSGMKCTVLPSNDIYWEKMIIIMALGNCNYISWKDGTLNKCLLCSFTAACVFIPSLESCCCNFCWGTSQAVVGGSVFLAGSSGSAIGDWN